MKRERTEGLISIIMPVYNAGEYLVECLESIVNQEYKNWELLAINDFSEDNSEEILRAFAQKDKRIGMKKNTTKGIIPALNLAFSHSSGAYITRMDADDIMPPSKLQLLAQALQKNPNSCVTAKVKYFSNNILQEGYKKYAAWLNELIDGNSHYQHIYKECVIPSPCWMMRSETLYKIGGITDGRYPEDYDMCFRLYRHGIPIIAIKEVLHLWRDHGTRASRNDPNYANQHFIELKLYHFLKKDYNKSQELILWGAGKTGKIWAKALQEENKTFRWITGNPNKIGHNIYGVILESDDLLHKQENAQIIVAIKDKHFEEKKGALLQTLEHSNNIFSMY